MKSSDNNATRSVHGMQPNSVRCRDPESSGATHSEAALERSPRQRSQRQLMQKMGAIAPVQRAVASNASAVQVNRDPQAPTQLKGVVQARQHFNANHQSMALPGSAANARDHVIQIVIGQAIADLADDATLNDAIAAINLAAQHDHLMLADQLGLRWNGPEVYLVDTVHNLDADWLGSVMHDQDPGLYLSVDTGTASRLQVNKDTGEERVLDAAGRYIPRTIARSVTPTERTALARREAMRPRVPNAGLTPLEHVSGGQNSQYTSYSRAPGDVVNSHGVAFNAQGTGRVTIDLLNIASANILDLSTHEGVDAHLRQHLPQQARANFGAVSADAKSKAEDELAHGIAAPAGTTNPHRRLPLTDQRWQALVDAYRTQEVLVQGDVPFDAVTSFGAFSGQNHPLTAVAQQGISAHALTAAQHSQTGATALATHRHPAASVLPVAWQAVITAHRQALEASKNEFLFKHKAQGVPNAKQRNVVFRQSMDRVYDSVVAEVEQVASAYHLRFQHNWNNATLADMTAELTHRRAAWVADLAGVVA